MAVSLLYRHGYFKQQINKEGWQEAVAMNIAFNELPIHEVRQADGSVLTVQVDILGRAVNATARAKAGANAVGVPAECAACSFVV